MAYYPDTHMMDVRNADGEIVQRPVAFLEKVEGFLNGSKKPAFSIPRYMPQMAEDETDLWELSSDIPTIVKIQNGVGRIYHR